MEQIKQEQAVHIKAAEEEQSKFMAHTKKMRVTLWDMITKGAIVAIRDAMDDDGR